MTTNTDAVPSAWAPDRIWLQREQGEGGSHTWCEDSIDDCEQAEYVRADLASTPAVQADAAPIQAIKSACVDWDLVERMRNAEEIDSEEAGMVGAMMDAQAREIERLRAAIAAGGAQEPVYVRASDLDSLKDPRISGKGCFLNKEPRDGFVPLYAAPLPREAETVPFQQRVQPWMTECFGPVIAADRMERNHRFFEEATELVQACGMTASEAHQLVDYTFGRPVGEPSQEVGGVMVTLAALCLANGLDMHDAGEAELARINVPETVAKIRAKQAAKPKHSPLPIAAAKAAATVTLTGAQLLEAFQFVAPDHPNDADQLECEVTIQYGDGHDGRGLYCWITEYPEEGAIRLDAAPASSAGDQEVGSC